MKTFDLCGHSLREFTLVYESDNVLAHRMAMVLFRRFKEQFGIALPVASDREPTREYEILCGNTVRTFIPLCPHEFVVTATLSRLKIAFSSAIAYDLCQQFLWDTLFASEITELLNGDLWSGKAESLLDGDRRRALVHNGELRILSNNIYGAAHGSDNRMRLLGSVYEAYAPDLAVIQESSPRGRRGEHTITSEFLRCGLREVRFPDVRNANFNPVFYRADRFDLIDAGYHLFTGENNGNSKSLSWAVFHDRRSDRTVGAYSHHYYYTDDEIGEQTRIRNAKETIAIIGAAAEKHGCLFLGGGDINCLHNSAPYRLLCENGFRDTYEMTDRRMNIGTCHNLPADPDPELGINYPVSDVKRNADFRRSIIDYLFAYGPCDVRCHGIIAENAMLAGTDHAGVYADICYN